MAAKELVILSCEDHAIALRALERADRLWPQLVPVVQQRHRAFAGLLYDLGQQLEHARRALGDPDAGAVPRSGQG